MGIVKRKGARRLDLLRVGVPVLAIVLWFLSGIGGGTIQLVILGLAGIGLILPSWRREPVGTKEERKLAKDLKESSERLQVIHEGGKTTYIWELKDWIGVGIVIVIGYAIWSRV